MLSTWTAVWALGALATCPDGGEVAQAPLATRAGEAQAFAIEVNGASVGTWQCRVVAGANGRLVLRAQLVVDPLLAAFLPARARMEVRLGEGGMLPVEAIMFRQRDQAQDEVRWRYTGAPGRQEVAVTTQRQAGPPRAKTAYTQAAHASLFDPLSAFFMLRQGAGRPSRCLQVAAHDGPWTLQLSEATDVSVKTPVGIRAAHHYQLTYTPQRGAHGARAVVGELWQAQSPDAPIYEVRLSQPRHIRAVLTTFQAAGGTPAH